MKYFLDTEFLEGPQQKRFLGIPCGKTKPTIELISIGMVSEDGREYYAISKEFNLREAWNRYDLNHGSGDRRNYPPERVYWLRDNVLKPIFIELFILDNELNPGALSDKHKEIIGLKVTYQKLSGLLKVYGKPNKQISEEVYNFCKGNANKVRYHNNQNEPYDWTNPGSKQFYAKLTHQANPPEFYTYYGDYDWVVFCWLFGKMIDLPKGFPMYSNDLKQMLDSMYMKQENKYEGKTRLESWLKDVKNNPGYPKQENEHNALADARWNKKLYDFLQNI